MLIKSHNMYLCASVSANLEGIKLSTVVSLPTGGIHLLLCGSHDDVCDPVEGVEDALVEAALDPRLRLLGAPQLERVVGHAQEGHAVGQPQRQRGHGRQRQQRVPRAHGAQPGKLQVKFSGVSGWSGWRQK